MSTHGLWFFDRSLVYKYQHNTMVVFILDGTHLMERLGLWCFTQLLYFSYIVVSFIGGGSWSTPSKPPICRKSLTNFYHIILQRIHLARCEIRTHNVTGDKQRMHR